MFSALSMVPSAMGSASSAGSHKPGLGLLQSIAVGGRKPNVVSARIIGRSQTPGNYVSHRGSLARTNIFGGDDFSNRSSEGSALMKEGKYKDLLMKNLDMIIGKLQKVDGTVKVYNKEKKGSSKKLTISKVRKSIFQVIKEKTDYLQKRKSSFGSRGSSNQSPSPFKKAVTRSRKKSSFEKNFEIGESPATLPRSISSKLQNETSILSPDQTHRKSRFQIESMQPSQPVDLVKRVRKSAKPGDKEIHAFKIKQLADQNSKLMEKIELLKKFAARYQKLMIQYKDLKYLMASNKAGIGGAGFSKSNTLKAGTGKRSGLSRRSMRKSVRMLSTGKTRGEILNN